MRSLGSGTYGKVVECWDRQAGAMCAVKVVRAVPKYRHAARTEVSVLQHCMYSSDATYPQSADSS
jgi:dual-specificity kinase